jgi:cytosine/adenosine deaminase-related metal-dependent hydrolase
MRECQSGWVWTAAPPTTAARCWPKARQALLLARLSDDPGALSAREALEIATRGGASVLGRDDIGHLAPGMAADFVAFAVNGPPARRRAARSGRGPRVLWRR